MPNENLRNYEQESKWLDTPYNMTIALIGDKGITVNEDGEYSYFLIADLDHFVFAMDMDAEFLYSARDLGNEESKILSELRNINAHFEDTGIYAISIQTEKSLRYLVFCHKNNPETFFKIRLEDYRKITLETGSVLLEYTEENGVTKPYLVEFENDMVSVR